MIRHPFLRPVPFAVPLLLLLLAACGESTFDPVCTTQGTGWRYLGPHPIPPGETVEVEVVPNRCFHPEGTAVEWSTGAPEVLAIAETRGDTVVLRAVAPGDALISVRLEGELRFQPLIGLRVAEAGPGSAAGASRPLPLAPRR